MTTTIYFIIENSYELEVSRLADALQEHLNSREDVIDPAARWYYDDVTWPIEFGVRLDFPMIDPEYAIEVCREIWRTWLRLNPGREARLEIVI